MPSNRFIREQKRIKERNSLRNPPSKSGLKSTSKTRKRNINQEDLVGQLTRFFPYIKGILIPEIRSELTKELTESITKELTESITEELTESITKKLTNTHTSRQEQQAQSRSRHLNARYAEYMV